MFSELLLSIRSTSLYLVNKGFIMVSSLSHLSQFSACRIKGPGFQKFVTTFWLLSLELELQVRNLMFELGGKSEGLVFRLGDLIDVSL